MVSRASDVGAGENEREWMRGRIESSGIGTPLEDEKGKESETGPDVRSQVPSQMRAEPLALKYRIPPPSKRRLKIRWKGEDASSAKRLTMQWFFPRRR
jgi:hypothetical protein